MLIITSDFLLKLFLICILRSLEEFTISSETCSFILAQKIDISFIILQGMKISFIILILKLLDLRECVLE